MIKNIKLFPNNNLKSMEAVTIIKDKFTARGFKITDDDYELAIAVGGDGSFLRAVHANEFNSDIFYVGVNSGTLGFAQEVNVDEIDKLITEIEMEKFGIEEIDIQEVLVNCDNYNSSFCSLNEIFIRDKRLGAAKFDIKIDETLLARYIGDGVLICTPFGSTAQNLSYGGSIVYPSISSLQITPIAPISSSVFRTLTRSIIIPSGHDIRIIPYTDKRDMIITTESGIKTYDNVNEIVTRTGDKRIKCLKLSRYNFAQKVNEKMINGRENVV